MARLSLAAAAILALAPAAAAQVKIEGPSAPVAPYSLVRLHAAAPAGSLAWEVDPPDAVDAAGDGTPDFCFVGPPGRYTVRLIAVDFDARKLSRDRLAVTIGAPPAPAPQPAPQPNPAPAPSPPPNPPLTGTLNVALVLPATASPGMDLRPLYAMKSDPALPAAVRAAGDHYYTYLSTEEDVARLGLDARLKETPPPCVAVWMPRGPARVFPASSPAAVLDAVARARAGR